MATAADRMRVLVDDLLEYSHVNRGKQEYESVDLNGKIRLIVLDLEVAIAEKKARINIEPLPVVKGYRRQLRQLFENLINNAIKYSQPNIPPVVDICARMVRGKESGLNILKEDADKNFHLIEVRDNGIGFDQQYADSIFNIFIRLHGNTEYTGTGVGLAIVKKVIENHKGYVSAQSEPGMGAVFKILLPV